MRILFFCNSLPYFTLQRKIQGFAQGSCVSWTSPGPLLGQSRLSRFSVALHEGLMYRFEKRVALLFVRFDQGLFTVKEKIPWQR